MEYCNNCGERSVIADLSTEFRVCSSCGVEQSCDVFHSQSFDADGRRLVSDIRSRADYSYRETKIYHATARISDIVTCLGLPDAREADVARMVSDVTDGEYGGGDWFPILVVACAYIIMRKSGHPFPIAEAAAVVGSDVYEVGRMVNRVLEHLKLGQLPDFDMAHSLERALSTCRCLAQVDKEKAEEMLKQGKFLLNCSVKWFLSTGRQPLPLVAAVLAFVADVNGVAVTIEEIAKEIYAGVATSILRKKELMNTLIKASKELLPWGQDVTMKNIVHNAPLLLRYMELKSNSGHFDLGTFGVQFHDLPNEKDSMYFESGDREGFLGLKHGELKDVKLLSSGLSSAYKNAIQRYNDVKTAVSNEKSSKKKRKLSGMLIDTRMGQSTKKSLSLDHIVEMNVGYDAQPPSYITGFEAVKRRRTKIEAAKVHIAEIMNPTSNSSLEGDDTSFAIKDRPKRKCLKSKLGSGTPVDWEDYIIELLLLRGVKEEEIEQGHYKRLLDLHMFGCLETK